MTKRKARRKADPNRRIPFLLHVDPALWTAVQAAAKTAGQPRHEWVLRALRKALPREARVALATPVPPVAP